LPVLRLAFKDEALRQFVYAAWRQFLDANSRKKKWTTGKKPKPIYPLLANTLEPLVYFSPSAGDNLSTIRDLMKSVAAEAGSADLAAIESEIKQLDREIKERVYDLYGLTPRRNQNRGRCRAINPAVFGIRPLCLGFCQDGFHPRLVVEIPADGLADAVLEFVRGRPAQFALDF
jgi:hypothetical protein